MVNKYYDSDCNFGMLDGKKICGTFTVNYMMENIELLCWCLHHYGVEAEITSGKGERVYQYIVLAIVIAFLQLKFIKELKKHCFICKTTAEQDAHALKQTTQATNIYSLIITQWLPFLEPKEN